ncbi:MAG: hypothetical protein IIC95_00070 [Chloroflexi bacterium]|nr:hypothetical protein [Chloroflexota bacterium]
MSPLPDWYRDFVAAVVAHLPSEIDEAAARRWINDPGGLDDVLGALAGSGGGSQIAGTFEHDKTKDGWVLVGDVTEPSTIAGDVIEITPFKAEGEEDLFGDEVVERVLALEGVLGQRHAEFLLAHPGEIPEEFQRYSLIFPGTIWRSPEGNHQVPCANWRQGAWELTFGIVEGGFDAGDRLVRLRA